MAGGLTGALAMVRSALSLALLVGLASAPVHAADVPFTPVWMLTASGGTMSREGDQTRAYGSLALTRKLGTAYVRVSATRFDAAVRQVDVTLPSTYTIGFLSAGASFGRWFVDGYVSAGDQRYRKVVTDLGRRDVRGATHSAVYGTGGDFGYAQWFGTAWSLTAAGSLQYIRSRALRERIGPMGGSEYETREVGATFGGAARIDHVFGPDRGHDIGLRYTHYVTTNASAALSSGARGANDPASQSGRRSDGWEDFGGSATFRVNRRLYLDMSVSRTVGATAGDITTTAAGARVLF